MSKTCCRCYRVVDRVFYYHRGLYCKRCRGELRRGSFRVFDFLY